MNEKRELLAETLGDGDGEKFARIAAAHTRRRQVVRKVGAAGLTAVAIVATLMTLRQPVPKAPSLVRTSPSAIEIISDEELLAQLKNESVLVLKDQSGITGIVFLSDNSRAN